MGRSISEMDARIAALERELADSDSDKSDEQQPTQQQHKQKKQKQATPTDRLVDGSVFAKPLTLHCAICHVSVTSEDLMREHLQGRKHKQAAKAHEARAEGRYCETCAIAFTSDAQLAEHCKGRKHRDRAGAACNAPRPAAGVDGGATQQHDDGRHGFGGKGKRKAGNG